MSDPMTNMEIEDVLSSIRRLVSEDLRPASRDSVAAAPRPVEPEGKLVLTPAFRISEPAPARLEDAPVWRRAASRYRTESAETDDGVSDGGATDGGVSDGGATDGGPDDAADDTLVLPEEHALDLGADLPEPERADAFELALFGDGQDDGAVPLETALMEQQATLGPETAAHSGAAADQPGAEATTDAATLEAAIAELEAAVAASDEEWEPDGSETASGDHFVLPPMGAGRVMAEAAEAFGLRHTSEEQGLRRLHLEPGSFQDDPSEPVWAEPAAAAGKPWVPGLAHTGLADANFAHTGLAHTGLADADQAGADQAGASMFASDDTLLDEGMLRELVIEVIRQELQGALGERITRNVRKLVRAEIHRALAGREFE